MRIGVHEYADGGRWAQEATHDRPRVVEELAGPEQNGAPVCAAFELACDEKDPKSLQRLLDALDWLIAEVPRRKLSGPQP